MSGAICDGTRPEKEARDTRAAPSAKRTTSMARQSPSSLPTVSSKGLYPAKRMAESPLHATASDDVQQRAAEKV